MAQQRRCALICKTSDCYGFGPNRPLKPFALPPPIGESRTDDGPREQLEAGNNPGSRQEVESLQGACPLRSGTPNPRPTDGALHSVRRVLLGGPTRSLSIPVQQRGRSRSDTSEPCTARIRACAGTHERIASESVSSVRESGAKMATKPRSGTDFVMGMRGGKSPQSVPERGFVAISDAFLCRTKIDIGQAGPPSGAYINFPSRRAGPPKR